MSRQVRFIAVIVLACFTASIFEPVIAYAKNTPDWWPYWETAGYRDKCPVDDGTHWHAKYCGCWFPLGWAFEPILYKSQKDWRNAQWERFWKWWSRIFFNYDAMIRSKKDDAIDLSNAEKIMKNYDNLLRAANALSVAGNFDTAFDVYFPNYSSFASAEVEELRLLTQWINLESEWVKGINKSGVNSVEEQKELERIHKLLWENQAVLAEIQDLINEITGFGSKALDWLMNAFQTMLDGLKDIDKYLSQILGAFGPIVDGIKKLAETMKDVSEQIKEKLDGIKNTIKDAVKKIPFGIGDKIADYIDDQLNTDKIMGEFNNQLSNSVGDIAEKFMDSIKKISDFDFESILKNGLLGTLINDVMAKINGWLGSIKNFLSQLGNLKIYKYGQTQALQEAGSMAGHMALVANRTDRELNGFVEIQLTAEHTKRTRRAAVRNNMVLAGVKAQSAPKQAGKNVKLGFN